MNRILMGALEIVASAIVLVPLYLLLNRVLFRSFRKSMVYCIFSFYLVAVYALVGLPSITYIRLNFKMNCIPFLGMIGDFRNSLLNVALFVPLGMMLPLIWKSFRARSNTVLFGFGMSLLIELLQIFTYRATDVNDLITNVGGTLLGFFAAKLLLRKVPVLQDLVPETQTGELYAVCGIAFTVMFFIQPFISPILWRGILY